MMSRSLDFFFAVLTCRTDDRCLDSDLVGRDALDDLFAVERLVCNAELDELARVRHVQSKVAFDRLVGRREPLTFGNFLGL